MAYTPSFLGGVRVALADVNGDGVPDIITGAGPGGGPHVKVFDGLTGQQLPGAIGSFYAFAPSFTGGVFVAAGDVNGDGVPDVIVGAGAGGGPHVKVFSGADGSVLASFYAYSSTFRGGVSVAAADVTGDGLADIITGAGPGGGPHVKVFSGSDFSTVASFYAYAPTFTGGVAVAAGDLNGDGSADIITGAGPGGGPHVKVFSGADLAVLDSFYAYATTFTGGVTVATAELNGRRGHRHRGRLRRRAAGQGVRRCDAGVIGQLLCRGPDVPRRRLRRLGRPLESGRQLSLTGLTVADAPTVDPPPTAARWEKDAGAATLETVRFLSGPQPRGFELARACRIFMELIRGFRALHIVGPCVTVFGSARFGDGHPHYQAGRDLGAALAPAGFTVMTGGGPGLMEAANRGAREAGGRSLGCNIILPQEQKLNRTSTSGSPSAM